MISARIKSIRQEEGATAVEYGLMVALIAVVIIVAVVALGKNTCDGFKKTSDAVEAAVDTADDTATCPS